MSEKFLSLMQSLRSEKPLEQNRTSSMLADLFKEIEPKEVREAISQFKTIPRQSLEMQAQICRSFGYIVEQAGGRQYLSILIDAFDFYLETDDDDIREKCVYSIEQLMKNATVEEISNIFVPFFNKLSIDQFYGKRSAAVSMICLNSKYMSESANESLISVLDTLSEDQSIEVRRDLAKSMADAFTSKKFNFEKLLKITTKLVNDKTIIVTKQLGQTFVFLTKEGHNQYVDDAVNTIIANKKFENVLSILSNIEDIYLSKKTQEFLYSFVFTDENPYVRAEATKQIKFISHSNVLSNEKIDEYIKLLAKDTDQQVLFELAKSIPNIIDYHKESCEFALSILTSSPNTRISNQAFEAIAETGVGVDIAIQKISETDVHFRRKISMAKVIGLMAKTLDSETFNTRLLPHIYELLEQTIAECRNQAVNAVKDITHVYGDAWYVENIVKKPIIQNLLKGNFQARQVAVQLLCIASDYQIVSEMLKTLANDKTSNVRLLLAKECPIAFKEILDILSKDSDPDVSYFASNRK